MAMYVEDIIQNDEERNIEGYPGYTCTRSGDIFSYKKWRKVMMTKSLNDKGYYTVSLSNQGEDSQFRIHVIVANTFLSERPDCCDRVNHIDGNKRNNNVENLEWSNAKHNTNHACENGLIKRRVK